MSGVFLFCVVVGGTILLLQFLMTMMGFMGDAVDGFDVGGTDVDAGADIDFAGDADLAEGGDAPDHHQPSKGGLKLAKYLTFQTLTAFMAFFGLGGLASLQAGQSVPVASTIAVVSGMCFMMLVSYALQSMRKLEHSGNESIRKTIGCQGRVYLRIPEMNTGVGKATITSQGRTMELKAKTPGHELATGTVVRVNKVLDHQTVEVVSVETTV